jgi:hypothetical protein
MNAAQRSDGFIIIVFLFVSKYQNFHVNYEKKKSIITIDFSM